MTLELKIRKIGSASGIILPREVLKRMRVKVGDHLFLTEAPAGTYRIIPNGPNKWAWPKASCPAIAIPCVNWLSD